MKTQAQGCLISFSQPSIQELVHITSATITGLSLQWVVSSGALNTQCEQSAFWSNMLKNRQPHADPHPTVEGKKEKTWVRSIKGMTHYLAPSSLTSSLPCVEVQHVSALAVTKICSRLQQL